MKCIVAVLFTAGAATTAHAAPAWHASADLDGDGKIDTVELTIDPPGKPTKPTDPHVDLPCSADHCTGTLVVGGASLALAIRGDYFGGVGLRVIDIDGRDKRKELLVTRFADGDEDPGFVYTVVTLTGGKLVAHELGNGTSVTVDGKGSVMVTSNGCPDLRTVTFSLRGSDLVEKSTRIVRTRSADQCSG